MFELGDLDVSAPGEGEGGAKEGLSEEAKKRFAASAAAMQKQRKVEKQAKKKDDQVARAIIQFLNDDKHSRFFILISKLVARNCPSIFILGLLSIINEDCLKEVKEYFSEYEEPDAHETVDASIALMDGKELEETTNRLLIDWITRLQMILAHDAERILDTLMLDDKHLDGSLLQLTTFLLQEFFEVEAKRALPFEKAHPLTASILQTVFEPFLHVAKKKVLKSAEDEEEEN